MMTTPQSQFPTLSSNSLFYSRKTPLQFYQGQPFKASDVNPPLKRRRIQRTARLDPNANARPLIVFKGTRQYKHVPPYRIQDCCVNENLRNEDLFPRDVSNYRYIYDFFFVDRNGHYFDYDDFAKTDVYMCGYLVERHDDEQNESTVSVASPKPGSPQKRLPPVKRLEFVTHLKIEDWSFDYSLGGVWALSEGGFYYRLMRPHHAYKPFYQEFHVKASIWIEMFRRIEAQTKEGVQPKDVTLTSTVLNHFNHEDQLDIHRNREFFLYWLRAENLNKMKIFKELQNWIVSEYMQRELEELMQRKTHVETIVALPPFEAQYRKRKLDELKRAPTSDGVIPRSPKPGYYTSAFWKGETHRGVSVGEFRETLESKPEKSSAKTVTLDDIRTLLEDRTRMNR